MKAYIRVWNEEDLEQVGKNLIVAGHLSAECFNCHQIDIGVDAPFCPHCKTKFKYKGFRKKVTPKDIVKSAAVNPHITLIDFDDFLKSLKLKQARKLLDI